MSKNKLTQEEAGKCCCHWSRRLTDQEARHAAEAVRKALKKAGIQAKRIRACVFAPALATRPRLYAAARCRVSVPTLGFEPMAVVAWLARPLELARGRGGSTVRHATKIIVEVRRTAGVRDWKRHDALYEAIEKKYGPLTKDNVPKVDAEWPWEVEVWDARVSTDADVRGYRRRKWSRYQPPHPFVYAPDFDGLVGEIQYQLYAVKRDLML